MKRIIVLIVSLLMIVSVDATFNFVNNKNNRGEANIILPNIEIKDRGDYINILMKNASYLRIPGQPIIPYYKKIITIPFGSDAKIYCKPIKTNEMFLNKSIQIGKPFHHYGYGKLAIASFKYQHKWYSYRIAAGLKNGKHVNYLIINLYPVRCEKNKIIYAKNFDLRIDVKPSNFEESNTYDFLIICPIQFKPIMNKLAEHRNEQGIKTIVVSLHDIYKGRYFVANGKDRAQKIKYFIKNAASQWGIKYVLLAGDGFRIPLRKVYAYEGSEPYFTSDLYYADVFKSDGSFSSWDTNNNGYYGEYNHSGNTDVIDLYPDVYVGRLPFRNIFEAYFVVNKIIKYDSLHGNWFKKMVAIAGDSFNDSEFGTDYIEGEITTEKSISYMKNFSITRIYASLGNLSTENIIKEISNGAGFIDFEGHGNYLSWATHPIHDYNTWIGISVSDMPQMKNYNKPAIIMLGGCHTSQIGMPYECLGYRFVRARGGAIATIGYTSLSWGADDDVNGDGLPDIIEYASGYLNTLIFKEYGNGEKNLGKMWGNAIAEYLNNCPVEWNNDFFDIWDAKTVESWILIGDPSMATLK